MRQLIAAVLLSLITSVGGLGVAATRGDLSPEVRAVLSAIQTSLTRLEAKMESQDRDQLRLEARMEKAESQIQELQRKAPR